MIKSIYKIISPPTKTAWDFILPQLERQISVKKQLKANAGGDSWKSKAHSPGMSLQTGALTIKISLDDYQEVKN